MATATVKTCASCRDRQHRVALEQAKAKNQSHEIEGIWTSIDVVLRGDAACYRVLYDNLFSNIAKTTVDSGLACDHHPGSNVNSQT